MKIRTIILILYATCTTKAAAHAAWTIFNYIEADNNLNAYGLYNVDAMKKVGSSQYINVLVQLDEVSNRETMRFKVTKNDKYQDVTPIPYMGTDPEQELQEGAAWAAKKYPSSYFMVILWNHGNGVLDEPKGYSRNDLRGILYSYNKSTYLNNQQLERALKNIHQNVLGKKIDIIGMDACLMASLEVCYQIKDHANLMVASENVEPAPGWDYTTFLQQLTNNPTMNPEQLSQTIVDVYGPFIKNRSRFYTLSAIKLNQIEPIAEHINTFVLAIKQLALSEPLAVREALKKARKSSVEYYEGRYIDIAYFYQKLTQELKSTMSQEKIAPALIAMQNGTTLINNAIFAYSGKKTLPECGGLSIYYPRSKRIHSSYSATKFAQYSLWSDFIKEYPAA